MFTGIVQALVEVQHLETRNDLTCLTLAMAGHTDNLELGASVAVNGTCLTVTEVNDDTVCFDVILETLRMTNLCKVRVGDLVNMERSFKVGDEIGGHVVSGHVTGTADVIAKRIAGDDWVLRFGTQQDWLKYVFYKGFIAIDGASLTVSAISRDEGWLEVSLIPETRARTTLGSADVGSVVNIEVDAQTVSTVETVERVLKDQEFLKQLSA